MKLETRVLTFIDKTGYIKCKAERVSETDKIWMSVPQHNDNKKQKQIKRRMWNFCLRSRIVWKVFNLTAIMLVVGREQAGDQGRGGRQTPRLNLPFFLVFTWESTGGEMGVICVELCLTNLLSVSDAATHGLELIWLSGLRVLTTRQSWQDIFISVQQVINDH